MWIMHEKEQINFLKEANFKLLCGLHSEIERFVGNGIPEFFVVAVEQMNDKLIRLLRYIPEISKTIATINSTSGIIITIVVTVTIKTISISTYQTKRQEKINFLVCNSSPK
ncbi:unnamed protein product [Enterobius vermicularis]|uniref:Uncharacterized protein n=1 Tax=Enterobius vermicularis TaxID=51028 RepID=A0A0N4V585_ENTVE|nr:unnamed protein product [Enterobius vermicularis]